MWITKSLATVKTPSAIALGNFDGIHRGHIQVMQPILKQTGILPETPYLFPIGGVRLKFGSNILATSGESQAKGAEKNEAACSTVLTFNPHPVEFFTGHARKLLTPSDEKIALLESIGVEQVVLLPFNEKLATLTPVEFVEQILVGQLQARRISVGWDFRFGRQRAGRAKDLQAIAAEYKIDVTVVPLYNCENGERISSSLIRQALEAGNLQQSNQLLGRPYTLIGKVIEGKQLGRTLGFPTANLQLPPEKFLPRFGVYAVEVFITKQTNPAAPLLGVMNVGCRPTIDGQHPTVEVHLLDWSGNLYEQTLIVQLKQFLRPEQKFASLERLKTQIQQDCATARTILTT